jgi:hypothetical protein
MSNAYTIAELFHHGGPYDAEDGAEGRGYDPALLDETRVGIECEVEMAGQYLAAGALPVPWWTTVRDGSLRNEGLEFVSSRPMALSDATQALNAFYVTKDHFGFVESPRTSTHVHVNVLGLTVPEVLAAVAGYCVVESALMAVCGTQREENIFCVPFYRAPGAVHRLIWLVRGTSLSGWGDFSKYSALNLGAIVKFGSIEFRHAPLWPSHEMSLRWVTAVYDLVENSRGTTAEQVMTELVDCGHHAVLRRLVPGLSARYELLLTDEDSREMGVRLCAKLAATRVNPFYLRGEMSADRGSEEAREAAAKRLPWKFDRLVG